jgi:hypothetical protein
MTASARKADDHRRGAVRRREIGCSLATFGRLIVTYRLRWGSQEWRKP